MEWLVDEGEYTRDPVGWLVGTVLEEIYEANEPNVGFFHVTTNLPAVMASGRLLSRKRTQVLGLGGGAANVSSDTVSFVFTLGRAEWLYDAIHAVARAAQDEISASQLLRAVPDWTGFPSAPEFAEYIHEQFVQDGLDGYDVDEDNLGPRSRQLYQDFVALVEDAIGVEIPPQMSPLDLSGRGGWEELLERTATKIDKLHPDFESKYRMVQDVEARIDDLFYAQVRSILALSGEPIVCGPLVGFTARPSQLRHLRPENVAILQAEVHVDAMTDLVTEECEMRFSPDHIRLVGVAQPVEAA